jgi:hypothetical protein
MYGRTVVLACGACLLAGGMVGVVVGGAGEREAEGTSSGDLLRNLVEEERSGPAAVPRSQRESEAVTTAPDRTPRERSLFEGKRVRAGAEVDDRDAVAGSTSVSEPREPDEAQAIEDPEEEVDRLRQELAALREEQREVMGEPVEPPADMEPRFGGATMSGAVQGALGQANVSGEVEATDCSEHPCIVFGRLEGDEEDMEEVERAAALSVYDGDILTLLFWATSVEEPGVAPAETGLFALAFYSFEDRASRGEELDRRIRARTMEYWNHDRPGRAAPPL